MEFKDRTGKFLNRKKLKIISQNATEIIADVERFDEVENEGTKINAGVFNEFQTNIENSKQTSNDAKSIAASANVTAVNASATAQEAKNIAQSASTKAASAIDIANAANTAATNAQNQVVEKMGTKVFVGSETTPAPSIAFDSAPQLQITAAQNLANSNKSRIDSCDTKINAHDNKIANIESRLLTIDDIYPVGAIYMSTIPTSPELIFGGFWKALKNRFLIGASKKYEVEARGGEAKHILTGKEMPSHTHEQEAHSHLVYGGGDRDSYCYGAKYGTIGLGGCTNNKNLGYVYYTKQNMPLIESTVAINKNAGNGEAHNNIPPYLAVYMWERTETKEEDDKDEDEEDKNENL